jgi:hypothetical protein
MSQLNLDVSPGELVWPRSAADNRACDVLRPANVAAYLYTPIELRGAAVGLLSLLRNEGGSGGTSMAQTIQERRDQFPDLRLGEWLDPFNPRCIPFWSGFRTVPAADRRSGRRATNGLAGAGEPARATGIVARLLRCVLGAGRCNGRACVRCADDETFRREEGARIGGE